MLAASAPVVSEPLSGLGPLQAPEPSHAVASRVVHVRPAVWPDVTELGVALMVMLGAVEATVTVVDCVAVPPAPVQVIVKMVVAASAAVACEPLVGTLPLQPPEAVQALASCAAQVSMVVIPAPSVVDFATRLTEGAGAATMTSVDCVDAPPGPWQVRVNVVVAPSVSIAADPFSGFVPLHPPLARQEAAPETFHAKVVPAPAATLLGLG